MHYRNRKKDILIYLIIKRFFDIVISLILLTILMPILLIIGLFICIETPGNPIFSQVRYGRNKKTFVIYKLRSMHKGSHEGDPTWTSVNDKRITKMGRFIRKYRIDEVPQLINVIKGDMTLIGPRPEVPILSNKFEELYPKYRHRLSVKPGITGWAQVNGGYNLNPEEKAKFDYYYIKNQGVYIDFVIILKTVAVVLHGKDSR